MALINLQDLLNRMDNPAITDSEESYIETVILPGVQEELESYCGRPLERKQVRERLNPDCEGYVWFSMTPVWQIISVVHADGTPASYAPPAVPAYVPSTDPNIADIDLVGSAWSEFTYKAYIQPLNPYGIYFNAAPFYYVTYIAGLDISNDASAKSEMYEVAKRQVNEMFVKDMGIRHGSVEQANNADTRPPMWTPDELVKFDRYRRRIAV